MLVLSRKKNERIRIGTDIWITIVDVRGDKVRVGIDAPQDVDVDREEVVARIAAQNASLPATPAATTLTRAPS